MDQGAGAVERGRGYVKVTAPKPPSTAITQFDYAAQLNWNFDPVAQAESGWLGDGGAADFISAQPGPAGQ